METENTQEYVVTLRSHEELDQFYDDLETPGGCDCIPEREVECVHRRNISRNTHYALTPEEAEKLKDDERVLDVVPKSQLDMAIVRPFYTQTSSDWDRSATSATTNRNWGLLRCTLDQQVSNWGSDGTVDQTATIKVTSSGRNVDVVIVDGHLDPSHPEFALNEDGTGGSRVNQYNWYQHTNELGLGANGTYSYPTGSNLLNGDDNHGMHVAGTVSGNSQGWARDAKIYNISPYATNPNTTAANYIFDYIRAFHRNKSVNPSTGRKNPTICNNSWGSSYQITRTALTNVNWRGSNYNTFTDSALNSYGLVDYDATYLYVDAWSSALVADIQDTINDGIMLVGAAGNSTMKIDVSGGTDYNNTVTWSGFTVNYHRGSWNSTGSNAICVGAVSSVKTERKATFSNTGPRIDVYAPGVNIISSLHTSGGGVTLVNDSRNSSYKLGKYQGTSMASPQVCGVLACLLEQYPRMTQSDAVSYLVANSKVSQLSDSGRTTFTWNVTNSGASDYVFSGYSSGNDISITAQEGSILEFNVNASGHPFWIKTSQVTGTGSAVTTGIITNNGTQSQTIRWDTYGVTPGTYYYICQFHSSMSGTITITASYTDNASLQGSNNRYLYYKKERTETGVTAPRTTYKARTSSGQVYPRTNTTAYSR